MLSQSLRCAVLFIVKIPQSIQEPAALPVQVMLKKGEWIGILVQHSAVEVAVSCQQCIIPPDPRSGLHFTSVHVMSLERKLLRVTVSIGLLCAQHEWNYVL